MTENPWVKEWLDLAQMDLQAAEHLLTMHPVPVEVICFHCQQSAEKALKAYLVSCDMEPPRTHDMVELCKMCREKQEDFAQLEDACAALTVYGVQTRYPSNLELNEADMQRALRNCKEVLSHVQKS